MDATNVSDRVDDAEHTPPPPSPSPTRSTRRLVMRILGVWSIFAVVVLALAWVFIDTSTVAGDSMEPTLSDGDTLVVSTRSTPHVGDIVTVDIDGDESGRGGEIIKRLIGVGGDELSYVDCVLTRNGEPVDEPYVHPAALAGNCGESFGLTIVPDGQVWVMGDNRGGSTDSRVAGPFDLDEIDGVLWFSL